MMLAKCLIVCLFLNGVFTLKILGIFPYQGKSHFFVFRPYLQELANRGHDVTVISHFPEEKKQSNYKDISLAGTVDVLEDDMPLERSLLTVIGVLSFISTSGMDNCEKMLASTNVQNLWKTKQEFDIVVVEQFNSDCSLGLAYKLEAPVVGITSHILMPWHYHRHGIPRNPSFVPFHFFEGGSRPSLYKRIESALFGVFTDILHRYVTQRNDQKTIAKYFDNVPPLEELARDIKFTMVYHFFPLTGSRLFPSNIIEIGGLHVAKPKRLDNELAKFINEAEHGVVYVSFGSLVKTSTIRHDKLKAIIDALADLPQRILFKWENGTVPGNPKNILPKSWLPQNDILAHPKVKAFISHGGMLSTTEAIHYGVPMIALPILGDQPANAASIKESGLGVFLDYNSLTKESLQSALSQVLDSKFRTHVKELSNVWHDRPMSPMDTAIFWTEFAARHSNFNFRSPSADVPFYQYFCLDIIALLLTILFLVKYVLTKYLFRRSRPESEKSGEKTGKRKSKKE